MIANFASSIIIRAVAVMALAATCGGCASNEVANFQAGPGQQALVRDGIPALVSRGQNSLVMIRAAARQFKANGRPIFVVGIYNLSPSPQEFRLANVAVTQTIGQQVFQVAVIPYETLVQEERNRQVAAALVTGLAAGANAYSAARAYRNNSTASAIAQTNAARQNEAMIDATIQQGQLNLANLERSVIKDNSLLPGEWYGGTLHLQPLAKGDERNAPRTYSISLLVGQDRHLIDVIQAVVQ
jgi:hypothetical protein